MKDMDKLELKAKLVEIHQNIINELKGKIEVVHSMADIDELDVIDKEDSSHQFESREMEMLVKNQLNKEEDNLALLKSIDFGGKSICVPGAVIKTEDFNFVIGVSTMPFEFKGEQFVGVSVNSPIYESLAASSTGQEFTFRGNNYKIETIY
jgi:hypothetical protein